MSDLRATESPSSVSPPPGSAIEIRAEPSSLDPNACRFIVSHRVHPGGPFSFSSRAEAEGSPLIERLFALKGVTAVVVADNVVSVTKDASVTWSDLARAIGGEIRAQLSSGAPAIVERERPEQSDAALFERVQALLDREVNPMVANHGGNIRVERVEKGVLYVRMSGGCQGCSASTATLRQSVETLVRRGEPAIKEIVDVTDHSQGRNPYYR